MTFAQKYNKTYKLLLVIPLLMIIISLIYMFNFYQKNQDIIYKDITLTGGTSITIYEEINLDELKSSLTDFEISIREISDLRTGKQEAVIIETPSKPEEIKPVIEEFLGYELTEQNSDIEFTGSTIGTGFYKQLRIAIIIAFILMSIVVFLIFRTFVPSFAVVLSAFADILFTIVTLNLLGMRLSNAGIVALLMLIGYSVDSDILLTTRILKSREGTINSKLFSAFKTGILMTLTSLTAVIISLLIVMNFSSVLRQIFTVLSIGLAFDLINTWITNAGILKLYATRKRLE